MTGRLIRAARNLSLALALASSCASLVVAAENAAPAAAAAPQSGTGVELLELDEVVVRGKALMRAISDAEDKFYELYNKLNTDDRYDTNCADLNINPENVGSRLTQRVCIPGFVADAMVDHAEWKMRCEPDFASFDANRDGRINTFEAGVNIDLTVQFKDLDKNENNVLSIDEIETWLREYAMASNCYKPPPPQLVLMEGSEAWYNHMLKVTQSDPRLLDMAGHLDDLYREWRDVQLKYTSFMKEDDAAPTTRHELGPRAR
jgi:hypothetical protein